MPSYQTLAKMIDHSLLQPQLTDAEIKAGCELAAEYGVASVCVKPYSVKDAVRWLAGSDVLVGCVIGFPHGNSTTESKRYETELACRDGAVEIDMVANLGKALSGEWDYVEADIKAVCDEAHSRGAKVKVIFENDFIADDAVKIRLCEACAKAGADWVKTSTGYGYVKQADGNFNYGGATEHDLRLMRQHSPPELQVKAAGGVRDLDGLILAQRLGATRCGMSATRQVLDEYRRREAAGELDSAAREVKLGGGY